MHITRGFKGKARADAATRDRVPPGQYRDVRLPDPDGRPYAAYGPG